MPNLATSFKVTPLWALDPCGVFREIRQVDKAELSTWLGASAQADLQRLLASKPPLHAEAVLQITQDEQAKHFCSSFHTASDLDRRFGQGQWRSTERFLVTQPDGKQRVIDNGRKSGHNNVTHMHETITTVNVDFVATVAQMVYRGLLDPSSEARSSHPWLGLRLGTDDLPDAYRGLAVCEEHLRFSNNAVYLPAIGWRFTTLFGFAYGLESAVVAFPQLGIAITRRCLLGMASAYFDDELSLEFFRDVLVTQPALLVFTLMGAPPQPSKSFVPTANRHYLGTSVHVGEAFSDGFIRFQPKSSTRSKVLAHLHNAVHDAKLERDTASKLRGDLNWMWSMCAGYIGRIAGPVLTTKQTDDHPDLNLHQRHMMMLQTIVAEAAPRDIDIKPKTSPLTRFCTDASFEDGTLRLGWIIFHPDSKPTGGTCVVPQATLDSWNSRKQQIYPGEAFASLVVPVLHPTLFAVASQIWAGSSQLDVHLICQFAHVVLFRARARVWYEWVDSGSNPSDGLSRLGLKDPWAMLQNYDFPENLLPAHFFASFSSLIS